jgi:adenylate kinase
VQSRLILLGPPGGGKGTQAKMLAERFGLAHISTGAVLRQAVEEKTELGRKVEKLLSRGDLVPDDMMFSIIEEFLARDQVKDGFILDGYPRTIPQALDLEENGIKIDRVLFINVPRNILVERLLTRRECPSCQAIFNSAGNGESGDVVCPNCGETSVRRTDDSLETINKRLETYFRRTYPLIDFYRERNLLVDINGVQSPEQVFEDVSQALN